LGAAMASTSTKESASTTNPASGAEVDQVPKGYVVGQSITERFKYEPVPDMTAMEIAQADASQNCIVRSVLAGVAGGVMGVAFGIFMGAMDPASMSSPAPLAEQPSKTTLQVLKSMVRTTRERSVYVLLA
jgi:hypothetical protein